jgi:hypothetical protein
MTGLKSELTKKKKGIDKCNTRKKKYDRHIITDSRWSAVIK